MHPFNSLSVRVKLLEDTVYREAPKIFGHCTISPKRNLAGKLRHTLLFINHIKQKNLLLTQISSTVDPHEQARLREQLAPIKNKIRNFCCAEKHRKRCIFKKWQERFNKNPYQGGKELLDSKSDAKLTVDKFTLNKFKPASVEDKFYDVPLHPLEGLPSSPNWSNPEKGRKWFSRSVASMINICSWGTRLTMVPVLVCAIKIIITSLIYYSN